MSAHIEFRCDQCATSAPGAWGRYGIGPAAPKGWHYFDDKHFCGYGCIAVYAEHEAGVRNVAGLWNRSRPTDETER